MAFAQHREDPEVRISFAPARFENELRNFAAMLLG